MILPKYLSWSTFFNSDPSILIDGGGNLCAGEADAVLPSSLCWWWVQTGEWLQQTCLRWLEGQPQSVPKVHNHPQTRLRQLAFQLTWFECAVSWDRIMIHPACTLYRFLSWGNVGHGFECAVSWDRIMIHPACTLYRFLSWGNVGHGLRHACKTGCTEQGPIHNPALLHLRCQKVLKCQYHRVWSQTYHHGRDGWGL